MNTELGHPACREKIFLAALRVFAKRGYAGASLREIVAAARLTKPTLYYYFKSKSGLFSAVLDDAYDQCFERMHTACAKTNGVEERLTEILSSLFGFFRERKDLSRLAFASVLAAPDEMPVAAEIRRKRVRNFEFVHDVVRKGQASGALDGRLNSRELTYGIYGALSFHVMASLTLSGGRLNRSTARQIVSLFMNGARPRDMVNSRAHLPKCKPK